MFKRYFPELKDQEAAFVRNPFSTSLNVANIPDELLDQFCDHQNHSSARDFFFRQWHSLGSNVLCANPTYKYPNWHFEYCFHLRQNTVTLREWLSKSCTYQKRKLKIKEKLKMI